MEIMYLYEQKTGFADGMDLQNEQAELDELGVSRNLINRAFHCHLV